ncbi:methionine--tRNA ligase [Prochlorococcus sp. MIT 1307]|uniref:methionine--tRNA ligase n=1 Tax=Prochlorococcus sp. MIT 1307 TaxID=3096219 RepID=UPI002A747388|nr:methionine--tRNA ligase [Prochlorococcus sp. MIT 1307]
MSFVITTPLYYVNDKPHLGSTYTTLACDALARFHRLEGEKVIFITGVDEHGQKIQRKAESLHTNPQQHCDQITRSYIDQWKSWHITYDRFVRTTSKNHQNLVNQFFSRVKSSNDIYIGHQTGWYCVGCEEYKDVEEDKDIEEDNKPFCTIHQKQLEWRDEENLFFRLSKYQSHIEDLIADNDFILPTSRANEIRNFVQTGLKDFSISRVNLSWGIPVPGFKGHTFYVWFDALLGYLTAILDDGYEIDIERLNQLEWPASIHVIGKDIIRFHAVYWPAMLISAGLEVPKQLFGHGFLTSEGRKMGKSLGNVLDPTQLLKTYGNEPIRWFLLSDIQFGNDGDFQQRRFIDLVNNDLANTIGNMLNRSVSMSRKWFNNSVPSFNYSLSDNSILATKSLDSIEIVRTNLRYLRFHEASSSIVNLAKYANVFINEQEPWKKIKDQSQTKEVAMIIYEVLETARIIGVMLTPLVPNLSSKILTQLSCESDYKEWQTKLQWGLLKQGSILPKPEPLITKIETGIHNEK